jgi:alcohol dehydrogenase (cytochrome c)
MQPELAAGTDKVGTVFAISAETGRTLWKYEQRAGILSLVATGGGLIFVGDAARSLPRPRRSNGKVLFDVNLGSPVSGYPITFAANGKQYVAVSTGPVTRGGGRRQAYP